MSSLTSVGVPWSCSLEMWRSLGSGGRWSRLAPPQFGDCRARCSSSLETTPSPELQRSTSTRSRALRSPCSSSGWVVSRMPACERSARRWRLQSTAANSAPSGSEPLYQPRQMRRGLGRRQRRCQPACIAIEAVDDGISPGFDQSALITMVEWTHSPAHPIVNLSLTPER